MRAIDADALLAEYDRVHEGPPGKARTLIEKAPTIEPEVNSIRIQEADEDFESCDDCIHYNDSVDTCVLRNCIHAITDLKECYERNSPPPDPDGADQEPGTVRDKLNSMTDDEFAEWLCHQIFPDYDEDDVINVMRYQSVRNFLKMDIKQTKEGTIC